MMKEYLRPSLQILYTSEDYIRCSKDTEEEQFQDDTGEDIFW